HHVPDPTPGLGGGWGLGGVVCDGGFGAGHPHPCLRLYLAVSARHVRPRPDPADVWRLQTPAFPVDVRPHPGAEAPSPALPPAGAARNGAIVVDPDPEAVAHEPRAGWVEHRIPGDGPGAGRCRRGLHGLALRGGAGAGGPVAGIDRHVVWRLGDVVASLPRPA